MSPLRTFFIAAVAVVIGFGVSAPVQAQQISVASDLITQRAVQPGTEYESSVLLRNNSGEAVPVSIRKRDYRFSADGSRSYLSPDSLPRSNASWISLSSNTVTVPPDTTVAVKYQVQVPARPGNATSSPQGTKTPLKGTYWSVLMVQKANSSTASGGRIRFVETFRYAIQVITHIGSTGKRSVEILSTNVDTSGDGRRLVANLRNNGTRSFTPDVYLELYDGDGSLVGTPEANSRLLYPSTSARYTIPLDSVASGSYTGMLVIDGGQGALFGARLDLQL